MPHTYTIHFYTGVQSWAGTNANIDVTLYGSNGESENYKFENHGDTTFESGMKNSFTVESEQHLGTLAKVRVGHDNSGLMPAWFLIKMEVEDYTSGEVTVFECYRWFDTGTGDGRTRRYVRRTGSSVMDEEELEKRKKEISQRKEIVEIEETVIEDKSKEEISKQKEFVKIEKTGIELDKSKEEISKQKEVVKIEETGIELEKSKEEISQQKEIVKIIELEKENWKKETSQRKEIVMIEETDIELVETNQVDIFENLFKDIQDEAPDIQTSNHAFEVQSNHVDIFESDKPIEVEDMHIQDEAPEVHTSSSKLSQRKEIVEIEENHRVVELVKTDHVGIFEKLFEDMHVQDEIQNSTSRKYTISFHTGTVMFAGTNANVFVTLYGKTGESKTFNFPNKGNTTFENGMTDSFVIDSKIPLETMTQLRVGHDNKGVFPGWFLTQIEVKDDKSGKTVKFPCKQWIAKKSRSDKEIACDLKREETTMEGPI